MSLNVTKYTVDVSYKIYNNEDGSYIEVCPDADGLGLVEVRYVDEKEVIHERLTFQPEQAYLVSTAINNCTSDLE